MKNYGYNPPMSEQMFYSKYLIKTKKNEKIIVHHVINTPLTLQLEIERRYKSKISFERMVVNHDSYKFKKHSWIKHRLLKFEMYKRIIRFYFRIKNKR